MSSAPLLILLTVAAIWPFGHRDRERREKPPEPTGTIRDLERSRLEIIAARDERIEGERLIRVRRRKA